MLDAIKFVIDFVLHLDEYLAVIISNYGAWTYGILFLVSSRRFAAIRSRQLCGYS
jgi:hypothetical protein